MTNMPELRWAAPQTGLTEFLGAVIGPIPAFRAKTRTAVRLFHHLDGSPRLSAHEGGTALISRIGQTPLGGTLVLYQVARDAVRAAKRSLAPRDKGISIGVLQVVGLDRDRDIARTMPDATRDPRAPHHAVLAEFH